MSIQAKLRQLAEYASAYDTDDAETCRSAADRIDALEEENIRYKKALQYIAGFGKHATDAATKALVP